MILCFFFLQTLQINDSCFDPSVYCFFTNWNIYFQLFIFKLYSSFINKIVRKSKISMHLNESTLKQNRNTKMKGFHYSCKHISISNNHAIKWIFNIYSIYCQRCWKMFDLYPFRKYLSLSAMLYLLKSQIQQWSFVAISWLQLPNSLSSPDRVEHCSAVHMMEADLFSTLQYISHGRNFVHLSLCSFAISLSNVSWFPFFNSSYSHLYSCGTTCHSHGFESSIFVPYSKYKTKISLRQPLFQRQPLNRLQSSCFNLTSSN